MDCSPLVKDQIEAGKKLLEAFEASYPVRVALWLKLDEESSWVLYIASDHFEPGKLREAYQAVARTAREIGEPDLIPFHLRLITVDDPLARAALEFCERYPTLLPRKMGGHMFGGRFIEGGYIYTPPALAAKA